MEVKFGEKVAKIISVEHNLLTVIAPKLSDVTKDTEVTVSLTNVMDGKACPGLKFTYFTGDRILRLRQGCNQDNLSQTPKRESG